MNEKFVLIIFDLSGATITPCLVPESEIRGFEAKTEFAITDLQNAYQNSVENSAKIDDVLGTLWRYLNGEWNQFAVAPENLKDISVHIKSVIITGALL